MIRELRNLAVGVLSARRKRQLKSLTQRLRLAYVKRRYAYGYEQLLAALAELDVQAGDVLMVHGRFVPENGFQESPARVVSALLQSVGTEGTLLMPSTPYSNSTGEYLQSGSVYSVNRTPSQMGILSEILRRHRSAKRSWHPAHPVCAHGPLADWFVQGHEHCPYSCGPGSPYEKLLERDAKVLFFDVGLNSMTFLHYLEHSVNPKLPFPLYEGQSGTVKVIDPQGTELTVAVYPFSAPARQRKRFPILETELRKRNLVREKWVGNTQLMLLRAQDAFNTTSEMAQRGRFFYVLDNPT